MRHQLLAATAVIALIAGASAARAGIQQYVYVGDYQGGQVLRFDAGATATPNPANQNMPNGSNRFIDLTHAEGIGGTNDVLVVASPGKINVYDISKGTVPPPLLKSITTSGFNGLRIALTADGKNFYVAGGNQIREYNIASGNEIAHVDTPNGHPTWGVTVDPANNKVFFTTGWTSRGQAQVYSASADLSGVAAFTGLNPNTTAAKGAFVGLTFNATGSDLFVVNGGNASPTTDPAYNFIQEYAADGTYLGTVDTTGMPTHALDNAFDTEISDGKLYVTSQNGACAVEFTLGTDGKYHYDQIYLPAHGAQLVQAKTIHFTTNNVPVDTIPEPATLAVLGAGLLGLAGIRRRA